MFYDNCMVFCLLTAKTPGDIVNKQKCAVVTLKGYHSTLLFINNIYYNYIIIYSTRCTR